MRRAFCLAILLLTSCSSFRLSGQDLDSVFDRVQSSVVTLQTQMDLPLDGPGGQVTTVGGVGSGVLFSSDGRILTAAHVVQTADEILVRFHDGSERKGRVVSSNLDADIAMVQLLDDPPVSAIPARLGNSDEVGVGRRVMVVGAPLGMGHTLTVGHISARRLSRGPMQGLEEVEFFQTDASINQGNSGGPMFNLDGEVVGIVSYILSQSGGSVGLGFAVTSNVARRLVVDGRSFWSGVAGMVLPPHLCAVFNTPNGAPAYLVLKVAAGSPAEALGLRGGSIEAIVGGQPLLVGGDLVLEVQGLPLGDAARMKRIRTALNDLKPGDNLQVEVLRGGMRLLLDTTVSEPPPRR